MTATDPIPRGQVVRAIAHRDLLEFVRDRRTLFVTLLMPMAMYPVLALASTLGLRTALSDLEARQAPRSLTLALSGADAERLATRLEQVAAMVADEPPADWPARLTTELVPSRAAQRLLDDGMADVWIDAPAGTAAALDGPGTVPLEARVSAVRPLDARRQRHLLAVVRALAEDARRRRIEAEGLPASVLEPVALTFAGGSPMDGAASMEGILPTAAGGVLVLLALLTATGAFYPAIDALAGEKERGTIETLLLAPATAGEIVTGKFLAIWGVTLATLLVNAASIGLTGLVLLRFLPAGVDLGTDAARLSTAAIVTLLGYIGLAAVAAATCLAVTSGARSGKEAQNTLTPVILLVSGLAGAALLPGAGGEALAAVPFAGQVALARSALSGAAAPTLALQLAISLAAAAAATWLLLRGAAAALTDEELLFRGPDVAGSLFARPARRSRPTPMQGFAAALVAFAGLWYAQGIAPADLGLAVPIQQAALVLPLIAVALWQRVDPATTFGLTAPGGRRWPLAALGGLLAGAGLFILGAAATLAVRGTHLSPAARDLAARIMELLLDRPWWLSGLLIAVVPAICEELFFRGWVLAAFAGERPGWRRAVAAVLLQAAAFAAFHLLPERMPQTFLLGAVLGWMTLATGSLVPAVIGHLAHNAVPLVLVALATEGHGRRLVAGDTTTLPGWLVPAAAVAVVAGLALVHTARMKAPLREQGG
jgi:sodium transport system permease protein